jgi:hypothetical protein
MQIAAAGGDRKSIEGTFLARLARSAGSAFVQSVGLLWCTSCSYGETIASSNDDAFETSATDLTQQVSDTTSVASSADTNPSSQTLTDMTITDSSLTQGDSSEEESWTDAESDDGETSDDPTLSDVKFDLILPDLPLDDPCAKIDFLFVIDNSRSMADEQKQLNAAVPAFIAAIRDKVGTQDVHVMVVDSDAREPEMGTCLFDACECSSSPTCCSEVCAANQASFCNSKPCADYPPFDLCDDRLGAGQIRNQSGQLCTADATKHYLDATCAASLDDAFGCAASVGTQGKIEERVMESLLSAVSKEMTQNGACNDGFLRWDSFLVVTFITDEDDKKERGASPGSPALWRDALLAVKESEQVVVVGLYGDSDQPGGLCHPLNESNNTGAQAGVRLRQFVELFGSQGISGSVCAPDYAPTFSKALDVIATSCGR